MSKVNILLDLSAKKIQRFFKNSLILKNYNLFLDKFLNVQINLQESIQLKKSLNSENEKVELENKSIEPTDVVDFGKFSKLIRQKDVINITEKFIKSIGDIKLEPKVLLTSLLLLFFREDLVGQDDQMNHIDKSLVQWVNEITDKICNLKNELSSINKLVILFNKT